MNATVLMVIGALIVALALGLWCVGRSRGTKASQQAQWGQEQQARDAARCSEIEEGLRDWLKTLQLPTLEEQTRLEEAARQLRIVLVEKLMRGPRVR